MANDKDYTAQSQDLTAQLESLRQKLYKSIDETIAQIAITCAGMPTDMVRDVIASVFKPVATSLSSNNDTAIRRHTKTGKETGPELHAAPQESAYKRKANWANSPKHSVYQTIRKRIKAGKDIEPDLQAAAIKLFPDSYDATTHTFKGRGRRKAYWESKHSVYQTIRKRIKDGKEIEPDLQAAAIKLFPDSYDATTHTFKGRGGRKPGANAQTPTTATKSPRVTAQTPAPTIRNNAVRSDADNDIITMVKLTSPQNQLGNYPLKFDGGKTLLYGGNAPYELVLFDKKTEMAVVRKKSSDTYHKLYIINCHTGHVVDELRGGARDIKYIPHAHKLLAREMSEYIRRYYVFTPGAKTECWDATLYADISVSARQIITQTFIIEENGLVKTYPLVKLGVIKDAPKKTVKRTGSKNTDTETNREPKPVPVQTPEPALEPKPEQTHEQPETPAPMPPAHQDAPAEPKPVLTPGQRRFINMPRTPQPVNIEPRPTPTPGSLPDLVVTTQLKKLTLDRTVYDIFVNGKRILQNHVNTKINLFLGGTILAIHGCVTDIENFPDNPSWQIFDTNLKRRTFPQVNMFTKKSVFIKDIKTIGDSQLVLDISNKMRVILEKRDTQQVFKISSENTK